MPPSDRATAAAKVIVAYWLNHPYPRWEEQRIADAIDRAAGLVELEAKAARADELDNLHGWAQKFTAIQAERDRLRAALERVRLTAAEHLHFPNIGLGLCDQIAREALHPPSPPLDLLEGSADLAGMDEREAKYEAEQRRLGRVPE